MMRKKGTGYSAWSHKNVSVKRPAKRSTAAPAQGPGRLATLPDEADGDACREAISSLPHSHDEARVFEKMEMTFQCRQDLVNDRPGTTDVFETLPPFLDVKVLVSCPFP